MDEYLDDLKAGKIQFRDKWQFELKTELFPFLSFGDNSQTQEFYFFIPNSLQINDQTYPKEQFYLDQTNLIRLKTPTFTFKELTDLENSESPFVRILMITDFAQSQANAEYLEAEVKLLGTIFHSALREQIADFISKIPPLQTSESLEKFTSDVLEFCHSLQKFRNLFFVVQDKCLNSWANVLLRSELEYIDEFISNSIHDYLTVFLNRIRIKSFPEFSLIDKELCEIILKEKAYRGKKLVPKVYFTEKQQDEYQLYRKGLLNKFVIDPLLLKINRVSVNKLLRGFILGIPAAIAMSIFLLLYVWQGNVFLLNSQPFILLTIVMYVLKDRIKEELRALSYRQAAKWFSDYVTEIKTPENGKILGYLREYVSFVEESKVPKEIIEIRNREFHEVLETFKRPERILYYKKTIDIRKKSKKLEMRFYGFSIIFRFDIHHFLSKAEDPYQISLDLESETDSLHKIHLPRVYHLNILLRTKMKLPNGKQKIEIKKYRLVIDKNGIKRVENF